MSIIITTWDKSWATYEHMGSGQKIKAIKVEKPSTYLPHKRSKETIDIASGQWLLGTKTGDNYWHLPQDIFEKNYRYYWETVKS